MALSNSKNIKSSLLQLEANRENVTQAKSGLYPKLSLYGNYGKKEYGSNGFGKSSGYTLSLQQLIYNPSVSKKVDLEESRIDMYDTDVELQKQELSQIVLKVYLDILKSENKIELYNRYSKTNQGKLELLEKKYAMALSNKMDLLQGKVDYHFSNIDLVREKRIIRLNKLRLKHLIGTDNFEVPKIDFGRVNSITIQRMRESITADSNSLSNLRIEQAKQAVELSNKEIDVASSGHMPVVSLDAQYAEIDADRSVSSLENTKSIMLQLQIPLYQGGMVESRITSAKLAYSAKQEQLLQVEDEIKEEYDELLAMFNSSSDSLGLYQEAMESAQLYLHAIQQGLDNGLKSRMELNSAKDKLFEVKYRYVENIYEIINSYIGLLILTNKLEDLQIVDSIIS
jgi:outer membrane protein